jgi:predicted amidophosphoribosyltransferase
MVEVIDESSYCVRCGKKLSVIGCKRICPNCGYEFDCSAEP